jgi:hypothetical protein
VSDLATKLRLLIPRLASDADGEVVATVAAIRRVLAAEGLDLHDLVAALTAGHEPTPAELAEACLRSGRDWRERDVDFLNNVTRFGAAWPALSERQAK